MFQCAVSFNGDISGWNVSSVTDMSCMFSFYIPGQEAVSAFNGDISKWNVSKVTTMECMFQFNDLISYLLYPKVFRNFHEHFETYGAVRDIPTLAFFF